jgi:hypothetical protein
MAITIVKSGETVFGNKRVTFGTYLISGGATTGDITTGLHNCEFCSVQAGQSTVVADAPTISAISGGTVSIIATQDTGGYWWAFGD